VTEQRVTGVDKPTGVVATCHCGAVEIALASAPREVTHCNCSLCRRYGVLWAYYPVGDVRVGPGATRTYAWGGENVDFHHCAICGCVTHWVARDPKRGRMGINARLLEESVLETAEIRRKDGAGTGLFH
jgi:hypothetical protein